MIISGFVWTIGRKVAVLLTLVNDERGAIGAIRPVEEWAVAKKQ